MTEEQMKQADELMESIMGAIQEYSEKVKDENPLTVGVVHATLRSMNDMICRMADSIMVPFDWTRLLP